MLDQARCGIGGHQVAMAWSTAMSKQKADRRGFAAQLPRRARRASSSATSAASRSAASASSRARSSAAGREIVGERYAKVSSPESIRFPAGRKSGGVADPAGRGRARAADPASDAADHRAGQPLLRPCGDQPHRLSPGQAAGGRATPEAARSFAPCPRNWARACAKSPIPSFAPAWSRLPRELPLASGPPSLPEDERRPFP